jgi:hypothetical protein
LQGCHINTMNDADHSPVDERVAIAREELCARIGAEVRSERPALLIRVDLATIVIAAVHAYFFPRHWMEISPVRHRNLVPEITKSSSTKRRGSHRASDQREAPLLRI